MKKKGFVYNVGLVFVVLIVLISAFIILSNKKSKFAGEIGEQQFALIEHYQKVEDELFVRDRNVKLEISESLQYLANNGGFTDKSNCADFNGLNMWTKQGNIVSNYEKCFPFEKIEDLKTPILKNLEPKLNLLKVVPVTISILENRLEFIHISKEKLISPFYFGDILLLDTEGEEFLKNGEYSVTPSFRIEFPYSFDEYELAKKWVEEKIQQCAKFNTQDENFFKCIYPDNDKEYPQIVGSDCESRKVLSIFGRVVPSCLKSKYKTLHGLPDIKFAFYIPDLSKPELDFRSYFNGGVFDFTGLLSLFQAEYGLSINRIEVAILKGIGDELPSNFENVQGNIYSLSRPGEPYEKTKNYYFNFKVFAEGANPGDVREFDYRTSLE